MTSGAWVLLAAVALAAALGGWRLLTDGRFRATRGDGADALRDGALRDGAGAPPQEPEVGFLRKDEVLSRRAAAPGESDSLLVGTPWDDERGERATLLQFSTAFCAPCRAARQVLGQVAVGTAGVAHVEVDAEQHLDLVRRLGVMRTPTTLVLDAEGREVTRAGGAPSRAQVARALDLVPE